MEINYNKKQWKFQFLSCSSHISVAQEPPVARGCRIGRPKKFLWTALREHTRFCLLTVDFWVPGTSGWITGHPSASFKAWIIILRVSRPVRGGRSVPYCPLQLPACGTRAGVTDITRAAPGTAEELTHPSWLAPLPPPTAILMCRLFTFPYLDSENMDQITVGTLHCVSAASLNFLIQYGPSGSDCCS